MPQLFQLAYISRSTLHGSTESLKQQVEHILTTAQQNNAQVGITGALLYSGGYFCQILEGPEDPLKKLYEKIENDARHEGVTLLHFHEVNERLFEQWAMAYAGVQEKLHFNIDAIKESKDDLSLRDKGKDLVDILDNLVRKHQAIGNKNQK